MFSFSNLESSSIESVQTELEDNRSGRVLLELFKVALSLRKLNIEIVEDIGRWRKTIDLVYFAPLVLSRLNEIGITIEDLPKNILENMASYNG